MSKMTSAKEGQPPSTDNHHLQDWTHICHLASCILQFVVQMACCNLQCVIYIVQIVLSKLHEHIELFNLHCVYIVLCKLNFQNCIIQFTVCNMQYAICSSPCTICIQQFAFAILHCALLYAIFSGLFALHNLH